MKKYYFSILFIVILLSLSLTKTVAQYDPQRVVVESKRDTLKQTVSSTISEKLDFQIYTDAYDTYLRKLQSKHRNIFMTRTGMTFAQTAFSNWAGGGENSVSGRAFLNIEHKYSASKFSVESAFDAAIGALYNDKRLRKSEDFFLFSVSPNYILSPRWELAASFILRSQFANSFKYKKDAAGVETSEFTSTIFAPAYITMAPGIKYTNISKTIEFFFSPSAGNIVMVLNKEIADKGDFTDKPGRRLDPQFINYFRFRYREQIVKNIIMVDFKAESFWNYKKSTPRLIAETKINFKLSSLFSANFYMMMIYDEHVKTPKSKHLQITETFGFGIGYSFLSKKHPAPPAKPRKNYKRAK